MQGRLLMMPSSSHVLNHQLIFHIIYGPGQFHHRQNKGEERRGEIWQKNQHLLSKQSATADGKRQDKKSWASPRRFGKKSNSSQQLVARSSHLGVVSRKQLSRVSVAVEWQQQSKSNSHLGVVVGASLKEEQQQEQQVQGGVIGVVRGGVVGVVRGGVVGGGGVVGVVGVVVAAVATTTTATTHQQYISKKTQEQQQEQEEYQQEQWQEQEQQQQQQQPLHTSNI